MEEVFKQLAESLSKFKGIDKIAEEGMRSINTAVKGLDLTKEQRQQIEDAKSEVSTQLKEYKKKCQLLSQIEASEG